jgi:hypothetical protein
MELTELINNPGLMDRDTLYELRSQLALYPYFQTTRLLMLQNLYLLHDATFDEELRRAALYITDRKAIFNMVEAAHYQLRKAEKAGKSNAQPVGGNRTVELIDSFLDSIPAEEEDEKKKRRPTPADAAIDYVAYLLATATEDEQKSDDKQAPVMKGQNLIDNFLEQEKGRILLGDMPQVPFLDEKEEEKDEESDDMGSGEEEYFTETLARIYIKQGRYQKALDIIKRLNQHFPQKNAYFADQIRFLEKLIINSNKMKN